MSSDLKNFLHSQVVATSRTTTYNPQGNGQVGRYNGIIWKTIQLALKTKQIKIERWEEMLPTALHSIRSLLCTATNVTPHERLFSYSRRSSNGRSRPGWLTKPGPVLLRNHVRENKYQPLVKEVHLLEANPDYAYVRLPDGRETTVSLRHLAPRASVRAETHEAPASATQSSQPTAGSAHQRLPNCSICEAVDYELSLMANSTAGHLPPDTQYEDSYVASTSTAGAAASTGLQIEGAILETRDEAEVAGNVTTVIDNATAAVIDNAASSAVNDNAVPSTSSCTCAATVPRRGKSKRHSCCDSSRAGMSRVRADTLFQGKEICANPAFASTSQDNNNLYPDPTAWCGDACESSSSSSPTYDQPTLSPSTSDSSSADADFPRIDHSSGSVSFRTIPGRSGRRTEINFESSRHRDLPEEGSKAPHFQKTLSNLKKFSLIKRKKKKRRVERPPEIGCSFVCQAAPDSMAGAATAASFDDGIDLTARNSNENIARPLEAINPHIGHKLASSGYRVRGARPSTIGIHRQRRSYDVHCCGSVVTVSGGTDCAACRNASSPESVQSLSRSHSRPGISRSGSGISRSGSICSETGERRHHRSAGSSPTVARSNNIHPLDSSRFNSRFSDSRYASSSHILVNDRERGNIRDDDHHIPVWVVNSTARNDYIRRSASGSMGEASRSVGDISSPLDFRDSMLSSGSSWEACSHL